MTNKIQFGIICRIPFSAPAPGTFIIEEIIMAQELSRQTFKLELEFTVAMDQITAQEVDCCEAQRHLPWLAHLQQALLASEPALLRLMFSAIVGKLQSYSDFLAGQDDLAPLNAVASGLDPVDLSDDDLPAGDFADLTRPLRTAAFSAHLQRAELYEQASPAPDGQASPWKAVWKDLRLGTRIGKLFEQLHIPAAPHPFRSNHDPAHYLMVRYLSQEPDGVHAEGRCTCEVSLRGTGADESQALEALWSRYTRHLRSIGIAGKLEQVPRQILSKN
jgi:hypothetical protein